MSRYNPAVGFRPLRDEAHASEIAGHRPMMAPRIVSEVSFESDLPHSQMDNLREDDPLHSLRGQPDELYEDESYHEEMNVDKFNRELRGGHAGRNDGDE